MSRPDPVEMGSCGNGVHVNVEMGSDSIMWKWGLWKRGLCGNGVRLDYFGLWKRGVETGSDSIISDGEGNGVWGGKWGQTRKLEGNGVRLDYFAFYLII